MVVDSITFSSSLLSETNAIIIRSILVTMKINSYFVKERERKEIYVVKISLKNIYLKDNVWNSNEVSVYTTHT